MNDAMTRRTRKTKKMRYLRLNDLKYLREIGRGSYSIVHLYERVNNRDKRYAVKEIQGNDKNGIICMSEFLILKNIVSPYIVGYRGYEIHDNTLYLILENAEASLFRYCKDSYGKIDGRRSIPSTTMSKWINQIAKAIYILHDCNLVHCDIKSDNILIFKNENVKIADFGMSTLDGSGPHLTNAESFRAPEIWRDRIVRKSIDVWSFGCVLYDIYYCGSLFKQNQRKDRRRRSREISRDRALRCIDRWGVIRKKMINGTYSYRKDVAMFKSNGYTAPDISPSFDPSTPLAKLIIRILNPDHNKRVTVENILADPFVANAYHERIPAKHTLYAINLNGYNSDQITHLINGYTTNEMTKKLTIHFVQQMWDRRMEIMDNITCHELVDLAFFIAFKIVRTSNIESNRFILPRHKLIEYEKRVYELKIGLDLLYHQKRT